MSLWLISLQNFIPFLVPSDLNPLLTEHSSESDDKNESVSWLSHVWLLMIPKSVHGILQARKLEWVAILFSSDLSNPGIKTGSPTLQTDSLLSEPPGKRSLIRQQRKKEILYKHFASYLIH